MKNRKLSLLIIAALLAAFLFASCVKNIENTESPVLEGRETFFAPKDTSSLPEESTSSPVTSEAVSTETQTPPQTSETAPETSDTLTDVPPGTENPVFGGGFSGLY